jgi:DNA-binding MarR family transcriptional regulator
VAEDVDTHELADQLRPALLKLGRLLRREARALGITGGQSTLLALISLNPDVGARELATREGVSAPVITRYLDRMEAAGLVQRERSSTDARKIRVTLTPKGTRALRSIRSRRTAFLAERLEKLSPDERAALAAAAGALLALVEDEP